MEGNKTKYGIEKRGHEVPNDSYKESSWEIKYLQPQFPQLQGKANKVKLQF